MEAAPAPSLRVGLGLYGSRSECNSGNVWRGKPCLIYSSTKHWCDDPSAYTLLQSILDLYGRRALLGKGKENIPAKAYGLVGSIFIKYKRIGLL